MNLLLKGCSIFDIAGGPFAAAVVVLVAVAACYCC